MRILQLTAENYKRLSVVDITPDGDLVVVAGKNDQGKSSVLDSIWAALAGRWASSETPQPVRAGEDEAFVRLDLGDIIVTRRWTDGGASSSLRVENAAGVEQRSPQSLLDSLIGNLSFNPLAFAQAHAKKQFDLLAKLVDLPFDLDEMAGQRQALFDDRTAVGRDLRRAEARRDRFAPPDPATPAEPLSAAEVMREARDAQNRVEEIVEAGREQARQRDNINLFSARIGQLEQEIQSLRGSIEAAENRVAQLQPVADAERPDLTVFDARFGEIEAINETVRAAAEWRQIDAEARREKAEHDRLTAAIGDLDRRKADALQTVEMPVAGLGLGDGEVLFNGVPFSQASGAQKLRTSVAMAMATNPDLRVIRITDGSLLDAENLALLERMATEHDFQIWIERVSPDSPTGVVIEEGRVAAVNGVRA